jgi:hypothetical protein
MTSGGAIYLGIILAAFLTYAATLFWAMVTTGGHRSEIDQPERGHSPR